MSESSGSNEKKDIHTLIDAGAKLIQVVSYERDRVMAYINSYAKSKPCDWYRWNCADGLSKWNQEEKCFEKPDGSQSDAIKILDKFRNEETNGIFLLENFHPFMRSDNYEIVQRLREIACLDKNIEKVLSSSFSINHRQDRNL